MSPRRPGVRALAQSAGLVLAMGLAASAQQNVLLVIADDLGVDRVAAYGEHPDPGNTPVIDGLAQQGLLFRNVWATPVCSSSRAALLTGRFGFRTGIGHGVSFTNDFELSVDEVSLADVMPPEYHTAALGKWHVHSDPGVDPLHHPLLMGFDHYAGNMKVAPGFISDGYTNYTKNVDGVEHHETTYATTDEVDDALAFIELAGSEPWFVWLAFHAPHAPFHKPPPSLHSFTLPPEVADDIPLHTKAAIEAMDTELGRLLASIDPAVLADTLIVFVGDNGTDKVATTAPFVPGKAKKTIYEGGLNVPLIISGPGVVQGAECAALATLTDLFATLAETVGVPHDTATDSLSLVPYFSDPAQSSIRRWALGEIFDDNGWGLYEQNDRAVRNERYKLLRWHDPYALSYDEKLYDLALDPFEEIDLLLSGLSLEEQQAYDQLVATLEDLYEPWLDMGLALDGTHGPPSLTGTGTLEAGNPFTVTLTGALENTFTVLFLGVDTLNASFKGGVLVPDFLTLASAYDFATDAAGELHLAGTWPAGFAAGQPFYLQSWVADPGAVHGASASNGLRLIQAP